jgi:hypothetical protein
MLLRVEEPANFVKARKIQVGSQPWIGFKGD